MPVVGTSMPVGVVVVEGLEHSGIRRRHEFESYSAMCDCARGMSPANSQFAPHH